MSIKSKLVVVITLLIIILFGLAAFVLINEKQKELTEDIFFESKSFGELTSDKIIDNYNLFLAQEGFVFFNREMADIFDKTQSIDQIQIYEFNGTLLYDSVTETTEQYQGVRRTVQDKQLLSEIQAHNPSIVALDGSIFYLKNGDDMQFKFVDENELPIDPIGELQRVNYFVFPTQDQFAVVYFLNYDDLDLLIRQDTIRIILLALLGMVLGLITAIIFSNRITKPLKTLTNSSSIIAKGDFKHRVQIKTKDELHALGEAFNKMAADLDISTKALVYKERVTKELELATKIQQNLIPKEIPKVEGLDISAGIIPAEEIGGDSYDFLKPDENNLMFYLGDVTGHGVPSGLLVSIANAMFFNELGQGDIKDIMISVNKVIKAKSPANMFITLCLLNWDIAKKNLTYVSAGHERMIQYKASDQTVSLLAGGGIALGMFPDIEKMSKIQDAPLETGDCLVLYSDGIPEAWKNAKEQYGMERFQDAVKKYGNLDNALAIRNAILQDLKEYIGDYKRADDITILVMKRI